MEIQLSYPFVYAWKNNPRRAEFTDKPCRIIERGSSMNSVLIEFEDGQRIVTSAWAVKRPAEVVQERLPL